MASLRKYPKLPPRERGGWIKSLFTIDRTLLASVAALIGIGATQMSAVNLADNKATPNAGSTMVAQKPIADYTPVGSIDKPVGANAAKKDEQRLPAPFGLRNR